MITNTAVIILAAGQGTRFGEKKQFVQFKGKEIWQHIYDKICTLVEKDDVVVVGVNILGGASRSLSVINGIKYFEDKKKNYSRILVLEAARPLVSISQLEDILSDSHESVSYALPLVSTIVSKDGNYLDRDKYYRLSTPVAFDYDLFAKAYLSGNFTDVTDDTQVMYKFYGIKPYFLKGSENLLKLTYQSDLVVLEKLSERYDQ